MSRSIAKNAAFLTAASVGQKIISFVYFTVIARNIGVEGTGKYFFALSFTTVFVIFIDLGFSRVLIREAAKARDKLQLYFSTVISVKILLGLLTYIAAVVSINLLGYPTETKHLVYVSAITMLFDSLHLTIYATLQAMGDLKWEAGGIIGSQLLTLILGTIFLFLGFPLIFLIVAFTIPSFLNASYAAIVVWKKYGIKLIPKFHKPTFMYVGKIAIPFAIAAVFARLYSYADSLILSKIAGDVAVGLYSIPYKITFAFQFIPLGLLAALYPRFSEYFVHDRKRLAFIFERGIKYLMIIAFPIAIGIAVLAKDIIFTIYTPEYASSVLPLRILIVSLIFSFVGFPIGGFLNACNKQVTQTIIVGIVLVVNVTLNLILIPRIDIVGAAIAALVGNFLLTFLGIFIVPKVTKISYEFLGKALIQVVISAAVMGLMVWFINGLAHFLIAILAGAVVYPVMLFVTRAVTKTQLQEAYALIKK
ncbi:MAG: flippase [Candidatus Magasanikbacteria bacterium]